MRADFFSTKKTFNFATKCTTISLECCDDNCVMKPQGSTVLPYENPLRNQHGALYEPGRPFGRLKWFKVLEHYYEMLQNQDRVSIRQLARSARVSFKSARKAIEMADLGHIWLIEQGHGRVGPGSRSGLTSMQHHGYIYNLYCTNPRLPADGYIFLVYRKLGIVLGFENPTSQCFKLAQNSY